MADRDEARDDEKPDEKQSFSVWTTKSALIGGLVAAIFVIATLYLVGGVSDAEAPVLVRAILPTLRFFASGLMTASATIMALMVTVLGLSQNASGGRRLASAHFERVRDLARIDCVVFIGATVYLLLLAMPLQQAENFEVQWYEILFYFLVAGAAVLGGLLISIVLLLYGTVSDMVHFLRGHDHPMVVNEDAEGESGG